MDKNTFLYTILPETPVYTKFDVYQKLDGEWFQVDAAILNTTISSKMYTSNKPPQDNSCSLFNNGDVLIVKSG